MSCGRERPSAPFRCYPAGCEEDVVPLCARQEPRVQAIDVRELCSFRLQLRRFRFARGAMPGISLVSIAVYVLSSAASGAHRNSNQFGPQARCVGRNGCSPVDSSCRLTYHQQSSSLRTVCIFAGTVGWVGNGDDLPSNCRKSGARRQCKAHRLEKRTHARRCGNAIRQLPHAKASTRVPVCHLEAPVPSGLYSLGRPGSIEATSPASSSCHMPFR